MSRPHRENDGFTLVEIMLVVAIVAVLAATAVPSLRGYIRMVHEKTCVENIKRIENACQAYQINHGGEYTTDLARLCDSATGAPLIKKVPTCPIGGVYKIEYDTSQQHFTVSCSSHDAESRGDGE